MKGRQAPERGLCMHDKRAGKMRFAAGVWLVHVISSGLHAVLTVPLPTACGPTPDPQ
jgi:hypothetical protein